MLAVMENLPRVYSTMALTIADSWYILQQWTLHLLDSLNTRWCCQATSCRYKHVEIPYIICGQEFLATKPNLKPEGKSFADRKTLLNKDMDAISQVQLARIWGQSLMYFLGWGLCIWKEFVEFVAVLLGVVLPVWCWAAIVHVEYRQ